MAIKEKNKKHDSVTLICPVLVVPDNALWRVDYYDDGSRISYPSQANHIGYYSGKEWSVRGKISHIPYTISHLEIITFSQIEYFITGYIETYMDSILNFFDLASGKYLG